MSLGGDFSQMFSGIGNRKSGIVLDTENENSHMLPGAENVTTGPTSPFVIHANKFIQAQTMRPPQQAVHRKPLGQVNNERLAANPYASPWGEVKAAEKDRLIFNTSPQPRREETPPAVPEHQTPFGEDNGSPKHPGSNGELKRSSAVANRRHSVLQKLDVEDADAKILRESLEAARHLGGRRCTKSERELDKPNLYQAIE